MRQHCELEAPSHRGPVTLPVFREGFGRAQGRHPVSLVRPAGIEPATGRLGARSKLSIPAWKYSGGPGCSSSSMGIVDDIRAKYERLRRAMDERVTRLWAASEALALGRGGIAAVVEATGISKARVRAGIADLEQERLTPSTLPAREQRVRRPGAGRPALLNKDPTLLHDLDKLVELQAHPVE
jgi:hypothetical protein